MTQRGFTPREWASGEPEREIKRRAARKCNVQDKETSSLRLATVLTSLVGPDVPVAETFPRRSARSCDYGFRAGHTAR